MQGANWQRSGGKGNKPQLIRRPDDRPIHVNTRDELAARRAAHDAELARRRAAKKKGA